MSTGTYVCNPPTYLQVVEISKVLVRYSFKQE